MKGGEFPVDLADKGVEWRIADAGVREDSHVNEDVDPRPNPRRIGGSDMAAILGVHPRKTAFDVWLRIVEGVEMQAPTRAMAMGKAFERTIATEWARQREVLFDWLGTTIDIEDRPWQRISPDGKIRGYAHPVIGPRITCAPVPPQGLRLVGDVKRYRWDRDNLGEPGTDQIGPYELVQVTTYVEALRHIGDEIDGGLLVVHDLFDDEFHDFPVPFSTELGELIVSDAEKFWRDHVMSKKAPPISGSYTAMKWLERRFPKEDKKKIREASAEELALALRMRDLMREHKRSEAELDVIKNRLRELMGDAAKIHGDWGSISWTTTKAHERPAVSIKEGRTLRPYFPKEKIT